MRPEPPPPFDLACMGSSLSGFFNITLDAVRHLQAARVAILYALNEEHLQFLTQFNANIIDLNRTHYIDGVACEDVYADIMDFVLAEARRGQAAYVQQGSPAFQTYTALELTRRARAEGLEARILPGVSSLECLTTHLGLAHSLNDLQLYHCASVAAGAVRIDPRAPLLLFNVSVFAAQVVNTRSGLMKRDRLDALAAVLAGLYPPDHPVSLIHLKPDGGVRARASTVGRLASDIEAADAGITLHIAPLSPSRR